MEPWIQEEWKDLSKREALQLCLLEAIKKEGLGNDGETRKKVKASMVCRAITLLYGFENCYNPMQAHFITRATIRIRETEKTVTGLWCTEERMRTELKYSK